MNMRNKVIRSITTNGIVAALYFILTLISTPFSFGLIQIRIAELLILLCFFRRDYVVGVTIGCVLSNLMSPLGMWDVLFGTLATLVSGLLVSFMRHLLIAGLIPVVINGFAVGAELYFLSEQAPMFWVAVGAVALGELIAVIGLGYSLFMIIGKRAKFQEVIGAERNLTFRW